MPLRPEQALDEATFRKVEGSLDSIRIASRQIRQEAAGIRSDGGDLRLAQLLDETADTLTELLNDTRSEAYFGGLESTHAKGTSQGTLDL